MVYATSFREYERYFEKAHQIIYGETAPEGYAYQWAKICWERQQEGREINLPSLKELKTIDNIYEKIRRINEGVFDVQ